VAYWGGKPDVETARNGMQLNGWQVQGARCGFAKFPAFAGNFNHAPAGYEGAQTSDAMLDFLYGVALGR